MTLQPVTHKRKTRKALTKTINDSFDRFLVPLMRSLLGAFPGIEARPSLFGKGVRSRYNW